MPPPRYTVQHLLDSTMLPNPATLVPFEKFAHLKNSDDMLERAAFWAHYAAWMTDIHTDQQHSVQRAMGVEARNDAYTLHAIAQGLHLHDAVIIQKADIERLEARANRTQSISQYAATTWFLCAVMFLLGVVSQTVAGRLLW